MTSIDIFTSEYLAKKLAIIAISSVVIHLFIIHICL